jgi:sn-glycerol 3-phosphate transport system substrate-binding protein
MSTKAGAKRLTRRAFLKSTALLAAGGASVQVLARRAPVAAAEKSTGTFWFNQPFQAEGFNSIIDRFHKLQDRVNMKVVMVPQTEMPTKLATAIAGGEPPDAARLGGPVMNSPFIDKGHTAALDDWDPKIGTYDWIPAVQRAVTRQGKMYAMPVNSGCQAFLYNKELYEASGLDPEKPPTTLDQLLEYARKIAKPSEQIWGHYALTAPNSQTGGDWFESMLWAYGARVVSEDGKKVVFNSPEGVAALQWYYDLVQKHKGMPVKQVTETIMINDFLTGKIGSAFAFSAVVARAAKAKFRVGAARRPAGPKGQTVPVGFGTIQVYAKGKNKEAGWEFAKFIGLNPENAAFWNISFGQLPARFSYRDTPSWQEYQKSVPLVEAYVEAQKDAALSYFGPGVEEISTQLGRAIEAVVFGVKTPQRALDEAAPVCQSILDRELKRAAG